MFTPSEKLPERSSGTRRAARRTASSSSGVKPVEPITSPGPPWAAAAAARSAEAAAVVKSTTTSASSRARPRSTSPGPAEGSRSNRATTSTPSRCSAALATAWPMRPSAPAIASFISRPASSFAPAGCGPVCYEGFA